MTRPALPARGWEPDGQQREALEITILEEQTDVAINVDRWLRLASDVLLAEGVGRNAQNGVEVSVLFVDEPAIATLNWQYMGKEGPTDVLSFPIDPEAADADSGPAGGGPHLFDNDGFRRSDDSQGESRPPSDSRFGEDGPDLDELPLLLGDIVICPAYAQRNAPEHRGERHSGSVDDELALLLVHGILHLLGMDHMIDSEAEEMEAREQQHLDRFYRVTPFQTATSSGSDS